MRMERMLKAVIIDKRRQSLILPQKLLRKLLFILENIKTLYFDSHPN